MPNHHRALFMSDLHMGGRHFDLDRLAHFFKNRTADRLYLVGDILEGMSRVAGRAIEVLESVAPSVSYIYGNHDFLRAINGWTSVDHVFHDTADGKRLLVTHGDKFDPLMNGWRVIFHALPAAVLSRFVHQQFVVAAKETAISQGCSGVICGHLHHPEIHHEGGFLYINTGDFVANCTAIAEDGDGHFTLLYG
jgi:UDP-2,3-diacylglucosamine pyrophosphatase LpxH